MRIIIIQHKSCNSGARVAFCKKRTKKKKRKERIQRGSRSAPRPWSVSSAMCSFSLPLSLSLSLSFLLSCIMFCSLSRQCNCKPSVLYIYVYKRFSIWEHGSLRSLRRQRKQTHSVFFFFFFLSLSPSLHYTYYSHTTQQFVPLALL